MGSWYQESSVKFLKEAAKHEPVDPQSNTVDMESLFPVVNEAIDVSSIPKMQLVKNVGKVLYAQPFLWEKKINFHPSQIAALCPHEYYFMSHYYKAVNSDDAGDLKKAKHSLKMLKAYEKAARSQFKPETHPKLGQGTAMHAMLQFYGGLTHDLVGQWRCPQCGYCTPEDKMVKMPTALHKDQFGKTSRVPKECPKCKDNINTHDWAWVYVEPTFTIPEFNIHGSTDGIRMVNDLKGIVEFKTINDNGFKENYGELPQESHVFQTHCYAFAMKADFINIIYINKDSMAEKEFIFLPDYKKVLAPAFAKIKASMQAVEKGEQPEGAWRACDSIKTPRAQKCPFAEECFGQKRPINLLG